MHGEPLLEFEGGVYLVARGWGLLFEDAEKYLFYTGSLHDAILSAKS